MVEILVARFAKIAERHRPHCTPAQRFRILEIKNLLGWSGETARVALVCVGRHSRSRVPLVLSASETKPGAADMARLLKRAARACRHPKYVITDLGGEFTGKAFTKAVSRLGARQRFACADSIRATARLERYWRSLNKTARLRPLSRPLMIADLEERLAPALHDYVILRPHEGLDGATPGEVFDPSYGRAVRPPRGRPGKSGTVLPFRILHSDPKNTRFPVLVAA